MDLALLLLVAAASVVVVVVAAATVAVRMFSVFRSPHRTTESARSSHGFHS
jgi:hypothetical protein